VHAKLHTCTTVVHNTARNNYDNFPSHSPHCTGREDIKTHVLAEGREQMYKVVRLSLVHQSNDRARAGERSPQHRLQQGMRRNLHDDGVVRYVHQSFLEQHRTHQVVDVVVGRRVQSQVRLPLRLRYRRADPAFCTRATLTNHLQSPLLPPSYQPLSRLTCVSQFPQVSSTNCSGNEPLGVSGIDFYRAICPYANNNHFADGICAECRQQSALTKNTVSKLKTFIENK